METKLQKNISYILPTEDQGKKKVKLIEDHGTQLVESNELI